MPNHEFPLDMNVILQPSGASAALPGLISAPQLTEAIEAPSWDRIAGVNIGSRRVTNHPAYGRISIRQSGVVHQTVDGEWT
jgi:hypothetical protein